MKWVSSCVDFSCSELFCIPELTSEFISSCDSVLGDSLVFYQENRFSLGVPHNYTGVLTSMSKVEFRMAIPAVTREYTPGSRRNSRNPMTDTPGREMRLAFPAFSAE